MNIANIIEHPYLVYKDSKEYMPKISGNLVTTLPSLTTQERKTISILEAIRDTEEEKERRFISDIVMTYLEDKEIMQDKDSKGVTQIQKLFDQKKYSQLITIFDVHQRELIKDCNSTKEALDKLSNYFKNFTQKKVTDFTIDFFSKNIDRFINKTIDDLFNEYEKAFNKNFTDEITKDVIKQFTVIQKSKFDTDKVLTKEDIFDQNIVVTSKSGKKNKSFLEIMSSQVKGDAGLPNEIAVGGANTGSLLYKGKNPDTDTIQIFQAKNTVRMINLEEELIQGKKTYEELKEAQNRTDLYYIHYSVKAGIGSEIKIKDEAAYSKRLEDIRNVFNSLGITNGQDFLFTLANTIPGMAADNKFDSIKTSVMQLFIFWMFDDLIPQLNQELAKESTTRLNFYNIGGKIFTASDILNKMLDSVNKKTIISSINIVKKGSPVNYADTIKGITDEEERWKAVYEKGMAINKLSKFRFNAKNLTELLLLV